MMLVDPSRQVLVAVAARRGCASVWLALTLRPSRRREPGPMTRGSVRRGRCAVAPLDVILDDPLKLARDAFAAQRQRLLTVDENRRRRCLSGARQADADVGMLALARPVDDAAHDGDFHVLDARVLALPRRHLGAQEVVDLLGEFLEGGARRAPAPR